MKRIVGLLVGVMLLAVPVGCDRARPAEPATPVAVATDTPLPPPRRVTVAATATPAPTPAPESADSGLWLPLVVHPAAMTRASQAAVAVATKTPTPTSTPEPCLTPAAPPPEQEPPFVGLHASADPHISPLERCTFLELRPGVIKVLTFHPPDDIAKLAAGHPHARWIVRVFLEFGGRPIAPEQFVRDTLSDTQRTLGVLAGRPVMVELHNEPNLYAEGLGSAWQDGESFAAWWLEVLATYRAALPGVAFVYPGLSPGGDMDGIRQDSVLFAQESRAAIESADALGVHFYWSADHPLEEGLALLDGVIGRFPEKPIWITEAGYNRGGISDRQRADHYLALIAALRLRPTVQGVTFFVASASDPQFAPETWVGKRIAPLLGER
jgi:hypothetical protein